MRLLEALTGRCQPRRKSSLFPSGVTRQLADFARFDMFGGGAMADYMERSALGQAQAATQEAFRLHEQARSMSNAGLQALPPVNIAQGNLLGDVLFDSTFSDIRFHQKIKATQEDVQRAAVTIRQNQGVVEQNSGWYRREMSTAWESLEQARQQLQKVREGIFARLAGENQQPPPYSVA
jgi:hypothetical protein